MNRKTAAFIMTMTMIILLLSGCGNAKQNQETDVHKPSGYNDIMSEWKKQAEKSSVVCWYTDETDKKWIETCAEDFSLKYGISVEPVQYDGVSMLEDINRADQQGNGPDMYIMGNDQLEFAVTGGIVSENGICDDIFVKDDYPETAKRALTYKGKMYGYPVYFDTYCLVYDANLLKNAPASIDDILNFLDEYEDTGSTKAIFRWDVADPYINTMFVAAYADLFGENGDDASSFKINGEKEVAAMRYYQSLSEFLWMDKTNISHDTIMNRIKEGTLVLGLCKTDILPILYEMKNNDADKSGDDAQDGEKTEDNGDEGADGESESKEDITDYRVAYVPSLNDELSSACLSTTYGAFINPYGNNTAAGNMFALYLSYEACDKQFTGNGKLPVKNLKDSFDELQSVIYAQYINSKPVPKTMVFGDYIQESGITYDAIWAGSDVETELDRLQNAMEQKIK